MRRLHFLLIVIFFLACLQALAGDKKTMSFIDILEVPGVGGAALSPDGKQLVFSKSQADWDKNRHIRHYYRMQLDSGEMIQLTNGSGRESGAEWSPDGSKIAFTDKRKKDEYRQIYVLNNAGGEALRLTEHPTSIAGFDWSPSGQYIYYTATDEASKKEKKDKKVKNDVYSFENNLKQRHLWRVDAGTGQREKITDGDFSVLGFHISKDGKQIVFTRAKSRIRDDSDYNEIWIMDADGKHMRRLTKNRVSEYGAELSPDGKQVLFLSWCNEKFEPYYNDNLFIIPAKGGPAKLLLADLPYEMDRAHWSADGRSIYFLANMGVQSELFKYDLKSGKATQLTDGKHAIRGWEFLPDRNLHIVKLDRAEEPGELWLLQPEKSSQLKQLTHVYDYLAENFLLPRQEAIHWKGQDGQQVEGILCYPKNFKKGQRYPLAVFTHGGPRSSDKYGFGRWRTYIPYLTAKGWAVLKPNYRGSTGYGDAFLRDMVGHYFNQAHLDVMSGVDYLIAEGIADPEKMVKGGWSAGGHMTNKIITFTDRFKAASSGAGAVNWISMYGQSDTRNQRTPWFGGSPWQAQAPIDQFWNDSPLKDIAKVKTPTIIFVGEKDPRVPMPQSVELFRALKSNQVPTALYVAPREPHGWGELRHRLFKMNVEYEWYQKYVFNRTFDWVPAPEKDKK